MAGAGGGGGASSGTLGTGASAILWAPQVTDNSNPVRVTVSVGCRVASGTLTARAILEFYDGTNWISVDAASAAALSQGINVDAGDHPTIAMTHVIRKEWIVPTHGRVILENTSGVTLTYSADVRQQIGY